jgi:hypothetical protein
VAVVLAAGRACEQRLAGAIIEWMMHLQQTEFGSPLIHHREWRGWTSRICVDFGRGSDRIVQ